MMNMIVFLVIVAIIALVYYVLYTNGILVMQNKKALRFIGKNQGMSATFTSCEGQIKRVIKFSENKKYTFVLKSELTKGQMNVVLQDSKKKQLICLSEGDHVKSLEIEAGKRYYLIFTFRGASGKYELRFE